MAGLNSILKLTDNVRAFERDLKIQIQKSLQDNEAYIVELNSEDQLFEKGENNLGVKIEDYKPYSALTIEIKHFKHQPYDRVTLRDSGDFHRSFYMQIGDDYFEIKASDPKTADLIKKYGRQILGLTDQNIAEVIWTYLYPDLIIYRNKYLYGTN